MSRGGTPLSDSRLRLARRGNDGEEARCGHRALDEAETGRVAAIDGDHENELAEALVSRLIAALEEKGVPEAAALADLMRLEQYLASSLRIVRSQIDTIIRRTRPSDLAP
jgi:hypothetical protein